MIHRGINECIQRAIPFQIEDEMRQEYGTQERVNNTARYIVEAKKVAYEAPTVSHILSVRIEP